MLNTLPNYVGSVTYLAISFSLLKAFVEESLSRGADFAASYIVLKRASAFEAVTAVVDSALTIDLVRVAI